MFLTAKKWDEEDILWAQQVDYNGQFETSQVENETNGKPKKK